ncbi:MAG: exostosin family protein, partial [Rhodospirillales bacterium]|nr:exostosin family protein [Acetobacter sp.]
RSKFVLCPRGVGTSSIRLFETLAAGRVPVIISDQWVPALGPDWKKISLRLRESEIASIPRLLATAEEQYPQMARAAWEAHAKWFSQAVIFHRLVSQCAELRNSAAFLPNPKKGLHYLGRGIHEAGQQLRGSVSRLLHASGLR